MLESMFHDLVNAGFLVPETSVSGTSRPTERNRIESVGIVTSWREGAVERCVDSWAAQARQHGRSHNLVISDDATDPRIRQSRMSSLAELSRRSGIAISYAGMEEKRLFADALADEGIDRATVRFALFDTEGCGVPTGANRNALLLDHVGKVVFHCDDDTVCQIASTQAEPVSAATHFDGHNPNQLWFFADRDTAINAVSFESRDLLASHEEFLGASLGACIDPAGAGSNGDRRIPHEFFALLQAGTGRIAVTQNGLVGDSGFSSCNGYLTVGGPTRERLVSSEAAYRSATTSRSVLQTVSQPTISTGAFCMSYCLGLDLRHIVPPFFPVRRNSDGVFGRLLRSCFEPALFAHVPVAILHDPPPGRRYSPGAIWKESASVYLSGVVLRVIDGFSFGPVTDGVRRMRMLGRYLIDVASSDATGFQDFLRRNAWEAATQTLENLERAISTFGRAPDYWAADCDRCAEHLTRALTTPDYGLPLDLREKRTREECCALTQRLLYRYGELLIAWPDIVEAAQVLRRRGVAVSHPV